MAIDNLAFRRDEDVFTLRQKNPLGLAWLAGEPEKFQVDGRRRRWWRGLVCCRFFLIRLWLNYGLRNLRLGHEDVPSRAFVLGIFTGLQPVIAQGGIERTGRGANLLAVRL